VGAIVVVAAGEIVPITGLIVYGQATINQRFVTGEAGLVRKARGDHVGAGARLQEGRIYVQIEQTGQLPITTLMRQTLERSLEQKTVVQQMGESSADRMAPRMLLTFALTLPWMGANHAAAFLTTGFGAHLRTLGPYTVCNFLIPAAEEGIVIKDARALEWVNLVNTVIIDGRVLADPRALTQAKDAIQQLRQRPLLLRQVATQRFAVYVLVETGAEEAGAKLVAELGLDDYFAESLPRARATIVEQLHLGGRIICYLGSGGDDQPVMEKARVAVAWRSMDALTGSGAHVVLMENDLHQLVRFFALGTAFAARQGFSLLTPIGLDMVDIATTVIVHLGLGYSILFNYAGLLLGAAFARWHPAIQGAPAPEQPSDDAQTVAYPLLPPLATRT
jgi:cation transport ATPase